MARFTFGNSGNGTHRRGHLFMLLKMWILSGTAIALWLTPLTALDKKVSWHKAIQGLSLCGAVACAVGAGDIARKLAEENEIEEWKTRAIKADVADEIAVSAYVSQQSRQQEAETLLASPGEDVEEARKALEAIYSNDLQEPEVTTLTTTSEQNPLDKALYAEVVAAREVGKSPTWIVENILKMKGRKFAEGKVKLQSLLSQFEKEA
ncbi:hypothetical protein QT975_01250 [Microcoleus sp. w2-18aC4]|uniref:hypothetical protein n=2 Tax=Microcoleus TaxID=44471 RepID=UPI002FD752E5